MCTDCPRRLADDLDAAFPRFLAHHQDLVYGIALCSALTVFANQLAAIMTASGQAASFTADYLRLVGWSVGGYGLAIAASAALTGRSRSSWAMGLSLLRVGVLYVPLAWIGVVALGYDGILAAAAFANVIILWAALPGDLRPADRAGRGRAGGRSGRPDHDRSAQRRGQLTPCPGGMNGRSRTKLKTSRTVSIGTAPASPRAS